MTQRTGASKLFKIFYEIFAKLRDSKEDVEDTSANNNFLERNAPILKAKVNGLSLSLRLFRFIPLNLSFIFIRKVDLFYD